MERTQLHIDSFLPAILRNLSEDIANKMAARYSGPFRLSITEWRILAYLAERGDLTATQIVEMTAMEKSKVSRALASLEERQFLTRKESPEDHRTKIISLTESGQRLYQKVVPRVLDWERELLEGLDVSEYRDLIYMLEKLRTRLSEMN